MDERLRFVARFLEGEKMAVLCREFDISRKTGYKIVARYKDTGLEGLTDRSRRPYRQGCQLPAAVEALVLQLKREYPSWGAPKLRGSCPRSWCTREALIRAERPRAEGPRAFSAGG
jgi:putative transposase